MESAPSSSFDALSSNGPFELPKVCLDLLLNTNGGEGDLGVEPGWFPFWSADDAVRLNQEYEVQMNLPGCFAFGSNGAGEMFILRNWAMMKFSLKWSHLSQCYWMRQFKFPLISKSSTIRLF
jgi:hypothetical protein